MMTTTSNRGEPRGAAAGSRVSRTLFAHALALLPVAALLGGCEPRDLLDDADDGSVPATLAEFSDAKFGDSTSIDNPYFPIQPGITLTYEALTSNGTERTVIEYLAETREVSGVTCRVVRDLVYLDDVLIEDTRDFYAQDDARNVWYLGEEVDNYAYADDGSLLEVTHEGSWESGKDVSGLGEIARPGVVMRAGPAAGDVYHQEYYKGEAEDMAEVVAVGVEIELGGGTTYDCLQTRDFTRLEPSAAEYKYFAPGIGLVAEAPVRGGERGELLRVER